MCGGASHRTSEHTLRIYDFGLIAAVRPLAVKVVLKIQS